METFDTNVIVRILVQDDPKQTAAAEQAWRDALAADGVFLPLIVLAECAWVLRTAYEFDQCAVFLSLRNLRSIQGVSVESSDLVERALKRLSTGPAGLADYLIREIAAEAGALPVRTFDRKFGRDPDVEIVR